MVFGFGSAAPRFPSTPQPTSVGADPDRGYGEYSTFQVPSQKPIYPTHRGGRPKDPSCNEHNYSQFLDKYDGLSKGKTMQGGSPAKSILIAKREAKRGKGTGSTERFQNTISSLLGPGEYEPELSLPSPSASGAESRPQSVQGSTYSNSTFPRMGSAASNRPRSPLRSRPATPGGIDAWRMTFSSANIAAKVDGPPSAFSLAAESVTNHSTFLKQRMTKSSLNMHCSETENIAWKTRPTSYLENEPQVKSSFNKRVNELAGSKWKSRRTSSAPPVRPSTSNMSIKTQQGW